MFTEDSAAEAVVAVQPALPDSAVHSIAEAREARRAAEQTQRRAGDLMAAAARDLAEQGYTVRDIGAVMGVSFQRVQQLIGKRAS